MPRRKQARRANVKDLRSLLRLSYEQGLSVRAISERLQLSKTTVSTYLLRAREAGVSSWPLPTGQDDDAGLAQLLFHRAGRPPRDQREPDRQRVARELKRKSVTLLLLWQEYRAAHLDGYGYTWFCVTFAAYQDRRHATKGLQSHQGRNAAAAIHHLLANTQHPALSLLATFGCRGA